MRTTIAFPVLTAAGALYAAPTRVDFVPSSRSVDCYDFLEITVDVDKPNAAG